MKKANHFSFQILTLFIFITFSTNLTAQNNSKFVVGLSERLRFVSWDNAITLSDAADAANTFTRHRTSVWADWKPSDNLQFYVKLTNEFRYYFNPDDRDFEINEIIFDNLYLKYQQETCYPIICLDYLMLPMTLPGISWRATCAPTSRLA